MSAAPVHPTCPTCRRRTDVLPLSSPRYECAHVDCPRRRPVTAAPSSPGRAYDETPHRLNEEGGLWD